MSKTRMQTDWNKDLTNKDICPICHGTGWEEYDKDGYTYCRECKCGIRQRNIMKNRLSFANIPESFRNVRMKNFSVCVYGEDKSQKKGKIAVQAVTYWLNHFKDMQERGMGLYLYSKANGSGKTRMAVSIANELIYEEQVQVKFATSLQILSEIKASWGRDKEFGESKLLDHLSTTTVLVIDDFGTEQVKDWIGERFYQIINNRYVDKKITIFTSNSRLDLLEYDKRIVSRIKERCFQIPFPEESIRDMIAQQNMDELIEGIKDMKNE